MYRGDGRIAVTFNGVYGDSGMSIAGCVLEAGIEGGERLTSRSRYDLVKRSREVFRVAGCQTICHGPVFMGTAFGIDNRFTVPPFMPRFRNEDGLFCSMLALCDEDAYFLHLPWAILHAGNENRSYECSYLESAHKLRMSDYVKALVGTWLSVPGDSRLRLVELGRFLRSLTEGSTAAFNRTLRLALLQAFHAHSGDLDRLLRKHATYPDYWKKDVQTWRDERMRYLEEEREFRPAEVKRCEGDPSVVQRFVQQFGILLCRWPEIRDAVCETRGLSKTF
jgi:hypothetical protein